jgi:hypothetical protein
MVTDFLKTRHLPLWIVLMGTRYVTLPLSHSVTQSLSHSVTQSLTHSHVCSLLSLCGSSLDGLLGPCCTRSTGYPSSFVRSRGATTSSRPLVSPQWVSVWRSGIVILNACCVLMYMYVCSLFTGLLIGVAACWLYMSEGSALACNKKSSQPYELIPDTTTSL